MSGDAPKHTAGPWEAYDEEVTSGKTVLLLTANIDVTVKRQTAYANARLGAAAPDLLAASKRALAVLKAQGESVRAGNVLGALEAAIAKAEAA